MASLVKLFFLISWVVGADAEAVVICPAKIASGGTYYCFYSGLSNSAPAQLVLLPRGGGQAAATANPDVNNEALYMLTVPMSVAPGDYTVSVANTQISANVSVDSAAAMLFIESDRKLYQPGHTSKFRVLAVTADSMLPKDAVAVEFEVVSPEGFKLMSVQGSTDSSGVAVFEFPIAAEPLLGDHMAQVAILQEEGQGAGATVTAVFTIEEYVLPRFEVNVTVAQSSITASVQSYSSWGAVDSSGGGGSGSSSEDLAVISGRIDATYTFGEKVAGMATVIAWAPEAPSYYRGSGEAGGPTYTMLAQQTDIAVPTDSTGSFSLSVDRSRVNAGTSLVVEVMVQDSATGEKQNATSMVEAVYAGSEIEVALETPSGSEFRPGLPVDVKVTLTKPDGKLLTASELTAAGTLTFFAQAQQVNYESTTQEISLESFVNGDVLQIVPADPSCCQASSKPTTYDEYRDMKGCCVRSVNIYIERMMEGDKYASRLYGGSSSSLNLERAYSPNGHYVTVSAPANTEGSSWTAALLSTQDFAAFNTQAEYMFIQGGVVGGSGTAALSSVGPMAAVSGASAYEATVTLQVPTTLAGNVKLLVILKPTDTAALIAVAATSFVRSLQLPFDLSASFSEQEVQPGASLNVTFQATSQGSLTNPRIFIASLDKSAELLGQRATISTPALLAGIERAREGAEATSVAPRVWQQCADFGVQVLLQTSLPQGLSLLRTDSSSAALAKDADQPYGEDLQTLCDRPVIEYYGSGFGGGGMMIDMAMEDGAMAAPMMAMAEPAAPAAAPAARAGVVEDEDEATSGGDSGGGGTVAVRKFFPETWLWTDVALDASGQATMPVTAPDTITTWSLEAFATAGEGVSAVRSDSGLRVFKPFFVEMRLPYAAIRNEELEINIAIFNYKESSGSLDATLTITLPSELSLTTGSLVSTLSVAENSASRATIRVRASALGSFSLRASATAGALTDALEKPLLVRPEGVATSASATLVLDLSGTSGAVTEMLPMELPDDIIDGSERLYVSAVGDLLGPTISGLERLLRIPTGCGEQNMLNLAPNVFVAKYLQATGKLTPDLRQRIVNNMIVGYGRELTYRHSDGSFSAFGNSDPSGSTWLTSFVIRVFAEVQGTGLVSVDSSVLSAAAAWLVSTQENDGSFAEVGNVIHTEMQGGIGGSSAAASVALTAYVTTAIAKAIQEVPALATAQLNAALTKATTFLDSATPETAYGKLLRAHALGMVGHWTGTQLADACFQLATQEGNLLHWSGSTASNVVAAADAADKRVGLGGHYARPEQTLDVELTAYGVLAMTIANDLSKAFQGARWLLQKRKASGGFSSTQDTVVALNALATYATSAGSNVDMTLQLSDGAFSQSVSINSANLDVMQSLAVPPPAKGGTANLTVDASGAGVALVLAELRYNLPEVTSQPCYDLSVEWYESDSSSKSHVSGCMKKTSACDLLQPASMWIMSVGMFTGYAVQEESLNSLMKEGRVKRWESRSDNGDFVDLYLDRLEESSRTCLRFDVTKSYSVYNLQAATASVYEYYAPEQRGEVLTSFALSPVADWNAAPTPEPSATPTSPTTTPTMIPTSAPTAEPTRTPTLTPTPLPPGMTFAPTPPPTSQPTLAPTVAPTSLPTKAPTAEPTLWPTDAPTPLPPGYTFEPTHVPTRDPTNAPTSPTNMPTPQLTGSPTRAPTAASTTLLTKMFLQAASDFDAAAYVSSMAATVGIPADAVQVVAVHYTVAVSYEFPAGVTMTESQAKEAVAKSNGVDESAVSVVITEVGSDGRRLATRRLAGIQLQAEITTSDPAVAQAATETSSDASALASEVSAVLGTVVAPPSVTIAPTLAVVVETVVASASGVAIVPEEDALAAAFGSATGKTVTVVIEVITGSPTTSPSASQEQLTTPTPTQMSISLAPTAEELDIASAQNLQVSSSSSRSIVGLLVLIACL